MTAHFSLNAPVWSLHLITRCFKQMAREGTAAPGCFRGAPGEPIQRTSQECRAAWPASAPEAEQGRGLEPRLPGEASKNPPTLLERGAQQGVRLGQQAAFCPRKLLVFLFWMVFWNRPDCICYLIQKVSVNVIHLQINFSASGWVSNKKEAPCGAQASAACGPGGASADRGQVASPDNALGSPSDRKGRRKEGGCAKGSFVDNRDFFTASSRRSCWPGLQPGMKGRLGRAQGPAPGPPSLPTDPCSCVQAHGHANADMRVHTQLHTQDSSRRTRVWAFSFANVPHLERA